MAEGKQAARVTGEVKGKRSGKRLLNSIANFRFDSLTFYYVALGLFYVKGFPSETTLNGAGWISVMAKCITYVTLLLLVLKLLTQTYTPREIVLIGVFGFITLLAYWRCRVQTLVFLYLFIVAAKDINIKVLAEEIFVLTILCVGAIMVLTQIGVLEPYTEYVTSESRSYFWSAGNTIYLWAFRHHNFLGRRVLIACMSYVIIRYDKFKSWDYVVLVLLFWFCYFPIKSRTSALIILLIAALVFLFKFLNLLEDRVQNGIARVIVYALMVFSPIFSVIVCVNYDSMSSFYVELNEMLTGRIKYAHTVYENYGFSVFGQYVEIINTATAEKKGGTITIFDNAYMHMFVRFGFVFGLLLFSGYLLSAKVALDNRDYGIALLIAAFAFCGISETWLYDISACPFPILASLALYNQWKRVPESSPPEGILPKRERAVGIRGEMSGAPSYQN